MGWLEGILEFLRYGPKGGKLDMNALFQGAVDMRKMDKATAIAEIDVLIKWQEERKKWHQDKTRQKMAASSSPSNHAPTSSNPNNTRNSSTITNEAVPGTTAFRPTDFGLHEADLEDLASSDDDESDDDSDNADPIVAERKRRRRKQDHLRRTAGEPVKPEVKVLGGLREGFLGMLRGVLDD